MFLKKNYSYHSLVKPLYVALCDISPSCQSKWKQLLNAMAFTLIQKRRRRKKRKKNKREPKRSEREIRRMKRKKNMELRQLHGIFLFISRRDSNKYVLSKACKLNMQKSARTFAIFRLCVCFIFFWIEVITRFILNLETFIRRCCN